VANAVGKEIVTLEAVGAAGSLHRVQQAFIDNQAAQCGYCLNGWIMTAAALLDKNANPTDAEISSAMAGLVCRCGSHVRILRAVRQAAGRSDG
jgi:nicotinate dehydrogenase subunit A